MMLTRCMSTSEARQAVEWPVLIAIGDSFGLGNASIRPEPLNISQGDL